MQSFDETLSNKQNIFQFNAVDIDGREINIGEQFYSKFKLLLIVNVASKWGKTKTNYVQLQELYERYHERGLEIVAFPCNQFKNQEPGSNEEIKKFASAKFGISFPMMSKVDVNGDNAHPLFVHLRSVTMNGRPIRWNFNKFLVDQNGVPILSADTKVNPLDMEGDIKRILGIV